MDGVSDSLPEYLPSQEQQTRANKFAHPTHHIVLATRPPITTCLSAYALIHEIEKQLAQHEANDARVAHQAPKRIIVTLMSSDAQEAKDFEERWPKDADRLFVESAWAYDAPVVRDPGERFYRMPLGYKRAGDILIDQATTDVVDRRNVIYAALFCYRQTIELFLKTLIEKSGNEKESLAKKTHNLSLLWEEFMCIVKKRGGGESIGLSAAKKLVAEMHEADQKSDGFRFPTDRDGAPFVFGDRGIDLVNVREVMQGLVNFFECVDWEFSYQDYIAW